MKRLVISVLLFSFVFTGIGYGQGNKPVKSISLDQLLGKKKTENVVQSTAKQQSKISQQGYREHIGAIGSVLERIELKGNSLAQDKISTPYRRYVVNGTMDLGGKTISIPDGCILDLENGSLKNGSIKMNTTLVTPIYGISKERNISKVKVSGEYYETLVDLWGEQTEPLFPWDTTAPKKVYMVDLKKFGITPGYQKRGNDNHYTDKQYDLMYNNGIGFTKAIRWAYDNGYDGIRFPKYDYCFTPRTTKNDKPQEGPMVLVQDYEKYDIDLGGGSYYLILDSKRKSKYYVNSPEKPYAQGGTMFFIAACINLQIHNGRMVGDRALRDYDDGAERNLENSRAFAIAGYCQNIRLHHIEICDFMADGVVCSQFGNWIPEYESRNYTPKMTWAGKSIPGRYVLRNEKIERDDNNYEHCTITNYLRLTKHYFEDFEVIRKIASKRVFTFNNNLGYTRLINNYHNVEILTFNEKISTEVPLRIIKTSYLGSFSLSTDETGVKIQSWYDEGIKQEGFQHSGTISDVISSNCDIESCFIHDNHRGGISGGCNSVSIRNCRFSKNHTEKNYAGKLIPIFTIGGTNYHINFEDSYSKDLRVYGCSFSRTSESIGKLLFGVYTIDFYNNDSDAPVFIYNSILSHIHHNKFKSAPVWFSSWRLSNKDEYNSGLQVIGFKYLTRISLVHDNFIGADFSDGGQNRTILFNFNNSHY